MATAGEAAARSVRIMKYSFLVYGALMIFIVFRIPAKAPHPASSAMESIITVIALVDIALGFFAPRLFEKLSIHPRIGGSVATPEKQWISRCVVSLSFFLSCILFGVVLHFTGARALLVDLLFGAGMLSLLFWNPGHPPGTSDGAITRF